MNFNLQKNALYLENEHEEIHNENDYAGKSDNDKVFEILSTSNPSSL